MAARTDAGIDRGSSADDIARGYGRPTIELQRPLRRRTICCTQQTISDLRPVDLKTMTYSESRAHYAETLNAVVDDREEVVITRAGHDPVVIVALADYESLKETAYLLRSPENARRLLASIDRLEHGGGVERDVLE